MKIELKTKKIDIDRLREYNELTKQLRSMGVAKREYGLATPFNCYRVKVLDIDNTITLPKRS